MARRSGQEVTAQPTPGVLERPRANDKQAERTALNLKEPFRECHV